MNRSKIPMSMIKLVSHRLVPPLDPKTNSHGFWTKVVGSVSGLSRTATTSGGGGDSSVSTRHHVIFNIDGKRATLTTSTLAPLADGDQVTILASVEQGIYVVHACREWRSGWTYLPPQSSCFQFFCLLLLILASFGVVTLLLGGLSVINNANSGQSSGPITFLLILAALLGFAWFGWVRWYRTRERMKSAQTAQILALLNE